MKRIFRYVMGLKSGKCLVLVEHFWDCVIMRCGVGGLAGAGEGGGAVRSLIMGSRVGEVEVGLIGTGLEIGRGWIGRKVRR